MTRDRDVSGSATVAASPGKSAEPLQPAEDEGEFLERQAKEAREALGRATVDFKRTLARTADPRSWIEEHPLIGLTTGVGLGFLAAVALLPSRNQTFRSKYEPILKRVRGEWRNGAGEAGKDSLVRQTVERRETVVDASSASGVTKTILSVLGKILGLGLALSRRYALQEK
jgi:hypothetical protein